jgi:hypothetical protein
MIPTGMLLVAPPAAKFVGFGFWPGGHRAEETKSPVFICDASEVTPDHAWLSAEEETLPRSPTTGGRWRSQKPISRAL